MSHEGRTPDESSYAGLLAGRKILAGGVFISIWFLRVYYSEYLNARNEQNVIKHFFSLTQ